MSDSHAVDDAWEAGSDARPAEGLQQPQAGEACWEIDEVLPYIAVENPAGRDAEATASATIFTEPELDSDAVTDQVPLPTFLLDVTAEHAVPADDYTYASPEGGAAQPAHMWTADSAEDNPAEQFDFEMPEPVPVVAAPTPQPTELAGSEPGPPPEPDDSSVADRLLSSVPLPEPRAAQPVAELTPLDLTDHQSSRWFVIQLALSENAFDPDNVPHLDLFDEYRLYSIEGLEQGQVRHALRLGFFTDSAAAQAVAGYLACYFDLPSVKRVSNAEQERIAERQVSARKDVGATGTGSIIELTSPSPLPARRREPAAEGGVRSRPQENSLWSRLLGPSRR